MRSENRRNKRAVSILRNADGSTGMYSPAVQLLVVSYGRTIGARVLLFALQGTYLVLRPAGLRGSNETDGYWPGFRASLLDFGRDPDVCRWLKAEMTLVGPGGGFLGYCGHGPVVSAANRAPSPLGGAIGHIGSRRMGTVRPTRKSYQLSKQHCQPALVA
jgi:hypothetical protein